MHPSLKEKLRSRSNDYGELDALYERACGGHLAGLPTEALAEEPVSVTLSATVVVPAYNGVAALRACLSAIAQGSFNQRYPGQLEVIVVDDGSKDGTWQLLRSLELPLRTRFLRQFNAGSAAARNAALATAMGDVVIFCDADMILGAFTLEELMKRHEVLRNVLLIGFRAEVSPDDPMVTSGGDSEDWARRSVRFWEDERISSPVAGWPSGICASTRDLKDFGFGRSLMLPDGDRLDLPVQVYTALCSVRRDAVIGAGGFDERFTGRGFEDSHLAARLIAAGHYVVPVYAAAGWHVSHSRAKWDEYAGNGELFRTLLQEPWTAAADSAWISRAKARITESIQSEGAGRPSASRLELAGQTLERAAAEPAFVARAAARLGRCQPGTGRSTLWSLGESTALGVELGRDLQACDDTREAIGVLTRILEEHPTAQAWVYLGLALAASGEARRGHECFRKAMTLDPEDAWVRFISDPPLYDHEARAAFCSSQGWIAQAAKHWHAALLVEPHNPRVASRLSTLALHASGCGAGNILGSQRSWEAERMKAAVRLSTARAPADPGVGVAVSRALRVPGSLSAPEAELIAEAALRVARDGRHDQPATIIDARSHCGQVTVLVGLACRTQRGNYRIVAIDDSSAASPIPGQSSREVFEAQVAVNDIEDIQRLPEEVVASPLGAAELVVWSRNGERERGAERHRYVHLVAPGGLLMVHQEQDEGAGHCLDEELASLSFRNVTKCGALSVWRRQ